jgi:hypothetical protein
MSDLLDSRPTTIFWIAGGAALIWNLFGLIVYFMQVSASPEELAATYNQEQIDLILNTPKWATSAFAIAVNAGVLGSLFLLLRKAWALPMFVVSLVAVLVQNLNSFVLTDTIALFGTTPVIIQSVIVAIAVLLVWYSRSAKDKGWLS